LKQNKHFILKMRCRYSWRVYWSRAKTNTETLLYKPHQRSRDLLGKWQLHSNTTHFPWFTRPDNLPPHQI